MLPKRHECSQCDYKTSNKGHLQSHQQSIHLDIKLFPCLHCEYKATQKGNLQRHIKSIHEGKVNNEATKDKNLPKHTKAKQFAIHPNDIKLECRVDSKGIISFKQEYFEVYIKKEENENSDNEEYFEENTKEECIVDKIQEL